MRLFYCLVLLVLSVSIAAAQVTTATFYGIVTDPSSAAIAGARVTITHEGTINVSTKVTDVTGEFTFTFLPVGLYKLRIEAPGFKAYESGGIELLAAQSVRKSFTLEIAGARRGEGTGDRGQYGVRRRAREHLHAPGYGTASGAPRYGQRHHPGHRSLPYGW